MGEVSTYGEGVDEAWGLRALCERFSFLLDSEVFTSYRASLIATRGSLVSLSSLESLW